MLDHIESKFLADRVVVRSQSGEVVLSEPCGRHGVTTRSGRGQDHRQPGGSGQMSADEAMTRIVEPGYRASVTKAAEKIERNFSIAERSALKASIRDSEMPGSQMTV